MNAVSPLHDPSLQFAVRPCPLCGGSHFDTLARHDRHRLGLRTVGCTGCGLVQTNPRPSDKGLMWFYAQHYRQFYEKVSAPSRQYVERLQKQRRLRETASYLLDTLDLPRGGRLLDYGCGEGSLFVALRESGYIGTLHGVEPDEAFARYAEREGKAQVQTILDEAGGYHGIVLNHVLEHLAAPLSVLTALRSRLCEGGLLYVDVPDLREYRSPDDLHFAHLWHFTPATLRRLLETAGFRIERSEAYRPLNHPRSIRVVARPAQAEPAPIGSAVTERAAWRRLRQIEQRRWWWMLRPQLTRIPPLRFTVRLLRRLRKQP